MFILKHQFQSKKASLKHPLLSTEYFSFNTLSVVQRNAADGSSDHSATTKTDREVFLKTVPFAHWSSSL
jgi:hypothetical protein